ncbi:MAG TPA: ABC transporter ATP-binding protein [Bacteroidota bacterium]
MKPLLRLIPYLARYKKTLVLGVFTVVMSNVFAVAIPLFVGRAIDIIKEGLSAGNLNTGNLLTYAGLLVGFSVVSGFFTFLTRQTIIVVSRKVEYDLRNDFLSHIQKLSLSFFQNTPTGDLMAHATNDISAVRNSLGPGIMYPTDTMMTFTMVIVVMLFQDWQLTLMALIPLPFVSFAVYRLGKIVHVKFQERQEQYAELTTRAQENLSGIRVVKAYVREQYEIGLFRSLSLDYLKRNLVLARVQSIMWPLMFLLVGLSLVITLYQGGLRVIDGRLTIGMLTAFLGYLAILIWPMIAFGWVINILQQGAASMARLARIWDTPPEIQDSEQTDDSIQTISGQIEFRGVNFQYRGAKNPSLYNMNLLIPQGSTVAIVGYTGAGKSTLVNLLPRLCDISKGDLLIDGIPIQQIPLKVLRENIGYVPQETFLFSDSIMENISYGADNGTDDHVREAAEISQLVNDVDDFPKGFRTMLGERGITLSGGQKQRASIARAVMRKPKILILDDALSAVDTHTEEEVLKRLKSVMSKRTSILISHRISTVKDADMIIVLHDGEIVERGTHDELVKLGGKYADLHQKQLLEKELEEL